MMMCVIVCCFSHAQFLVEAQETPISGPFYQQYLVQDKTSQKLLEDDKAGESLKRRKLQNSQFSIKYANSYCQEDGSGQWAGTFNLGETNLITPIEGCFLKCQYTLNCIELSFSTDGNCRLYSKECSQSAESVAWQHYTYTPSPILTTASAILIISHKYSIQYASNRISYSAFGDIYTVETCKQLCRSTSTCDGFGLGKEPDSDYFGRCDMYHEIDTVTYDDLHNFDWYKLKNGRYYIKRIDQWCSSENTEFIISISQLNVLQSCLDLCSVTESCVQVSYHSSDKQCYLLKEGCVYTSQAGYNIYNRELNCDFVERIPAIQIKTLSYKTTTTYQQMTDIQLEFLSLEPFCKISSLILKTVGCGSNYSGNLQINDNKIYGKQNLLQGYSETVCIQFTDSDDVTYTKDNLQFTQTPLNCDQSLVAIANPSKSVPYVHGGSGVTYSYTDFFTFTPIAGCIVDCTYGDTCGGTFTGTDVQLTLSTTPWQITASNSIIQGYSKSLCLNCNSNNAVSPFQNTFQITQLYCGKEKVVIVDKSNKVFNIKGTKSSSSPLLIFKLANIWQVDINNNFLRIKDCPIQKWEMCDDPLCSKFSAEKWQTFKNDSLIIDISYGIPKVTKYLAAITLGNAIGSHPISIIICGQERIDYNYPISTYQNLVGESAVLQDLKFLFRSSDELNCPITDYQLTSISNDPLSEDVAKLINIQDTILEFQFTYVKTFLFKIKALTQSGQFGEQIFTVIIHGIPNTPPKFSLDVDPIFKVQLTNGVDGEIEDQSVVIYTSPQAIDEQKDKIVMEFENKYSFIRVYQTDEDTFKIKVNKALLPKKSANYNVTIGLKDERKAVNYVQSMITVEVEYVDKLAQGTIEEIESNEKEETNNDTSPQTPIPTNEVKQIENEQQKPQSVELSALEQLEANTINEIVLEDFPSSENMTEEQLANECFEDCEEDEEENVFEDDEDKEEDIEDNTETSDLESAEVESNQQDKSVKTSNQKKEGKLNSQTSDKIKEKAEILSLEQSYKIIRQEIKIAIKKQKILKKKNQRAEQNTKLRYNGFARTRAGYVIPGCSIADIEYASKYLKFIKNKKSIELPEDPKIQLEPITQEGGVNIDFSQPMLSPEEGTYLQPKIYNHLMNLEVESMGDRSVFKGSFGTSTINRILSASDIEQEAQYMAFIPTMKTHDSKELSFQLAFDYPDKMSIGESAQLFIEIKEPSVLKSLKTLKTIKEMYFQRPLPPLLPDPEQADSLKKMAEKFVEIIENSLQSNFFIMIILGSAMKSFWGMIRAIQMISLSATIRVTTPALMMLYLTICIEFSKMDIFSGEDFYENNFVFKETSAPSEQFDFFGIGDSNFVNNSGSYFVILIGLGVQYIVFYITNNRCVKAANNQYARKLGMITYRRSYCKEFMKDTYKLFLESYFELVMCSTINLLAFIKYGSEFKSFFQTGDDAICSIITIIYVVLVLLFPCISLRLINQFQGNLEGNQSDFLSVIMENVRPDSYHASMYTVYFILRRLATAIILTALVNWPFFACTFLMVFSTINFLYLTVVKPLQSKQENMTESLNEICIYFCSQIYSVLCRAEGGYIFINKMGWSYMVVCSFNIVVNVILMLYCSILNIFQLCQEKYNQKRIDDVLSQRRENRDLIVLNLPGYFNLIEEEISVHDAILFCKGWIYHQRWLKDNNVKFDEYPEEIKFQEICKKFKLEKRAMQVQITKGIKFVANQLAQKEIKEIKANNIKIRMRIEFLKKQSQKNNSHVDLRISNVTKEVKKEAIVVNASQLNLEKIPEESFSDNNDSKNQIGGNSSDSSVSEEIPLEKQEIVVIQKKNIFRKHHDKIQNFYTKQGFIPSNVTFKFNDKHILKKTESEMVKEKLNQSKSLRVALNCEIIDNIQLQSDHQFLTRKLIYRQQQNLDFLIEAKDVTPEMIQEVIQTDLIKANDQKIEEFKTGKSVSPMENGGPNEVLQAVLQCLAGYMKFVKFFMNEKHLIEKSGSPSLKPMTKIISQVFDNLFMTDLNAASQNIDIGFVAQYLKNYFAMNENQCATKVTMKIIEMLVIEWTPKELMIKMETPTDRINQDTSDFQNSSYFHKQFSILVQNKFVCPNMHISKNLFYHLGLNLNNIKKGSTIQNLFSNFFAKQIQSIKCNECKTVHTEEYGKQISSVIQFPKCLILFIDSFDQDGNLNNPLINQINLSMNVTCYLDSEVRSADKYINYDLQGIVSYEESITDSRSIYSAIVKKNIDDDKLQQWVKFKGGKYETVTQEKALEHPAQILFYNLQSNKVSKQNDK